MVRAIGKRQLPLVGQAGGVWSFVHIADAAEATIQAIEGRGRGIYNVVDDEPAAVAEWLPFAGRGSAGPTPRTPLAGPPVRGRVRDGDDDRGPRRLERQGEARAGLGALVVVMADQHDRAAEVRVEQRRTGDQQRATEGCHASIMLDDTD